MTDLLRLRLVRLDPGRVVNLLVRLARIQKGVLFQREGDDERVVAELEILLESSETHGSVTVPKEGVQYRHEERGKEGGRTALPSSFRYLRLIFLLPTRTLVQLSRPLSNRIWSKILPVTKGEGRQSCKKQLSRRRVKRLREREAGGEGDEDTTYNSVFSRLSMLLNVST